ncbi:hypothetical protein BH10PSE19_BH10PSE19_22510 [soil metagenome]
MTTKPEKSIQTILAGQNSFLEPIFQQLQQINTLDALLQSFLDAELRPYCRVANLRDGCLVIQAENSAWATRLRYALPQLLQQFRTEGNLPALRSIKCILSS